MTGFYPSFFVPSPQLVVVVHIGISQATPNTARGSGLLATAHSKLTGAWQQG